MVGMEKNTLGSCFSTTVNGEGQPQSYFKYFLIALLLLWRYFWKKKENKAALLAHDYKSHKVIPLECCDFTY
jgi:hypothetical protein